MSRRNISLPDELDDRARKAGLNVSALARRAIVAELDRQARMRRIDDWLDELDEQFGPPSARAMSAATKWAESAVPLEASRPATEARPPTERAQSRRTPKATGIAPSRARRVAS